jgi:hypothetical protein
VVLPPFGTLFLVALVIYHFLYKSGYLFFKKVANGIIITKRLSKVSVIDKAVGNRRNSKIDINVIGKLKIEEDNHEFDDDEIALIKKDVPEILEAQDGLE